MIARWRRLHRNAGWSGVLRTVLVGCAIVGFAVVGPLARPDLWTLSVGAALGALAPWLVRGALVEHLEASLRWHRLAGIGIFVTLIVAKEPLKAASPGVQGVALGALSAYMSAYFMLLSDHEVVMLPDLPPLPPRDGTPPQEA